MLFLITLIFPPYISLLYILLDVYKTKKAKPKHCFAALLLLAMIGIYWFPWGDSQSHFAYYLSDIVETYYSDYSIKNTYWLYDLTITKIANFIGNYTYGYFFWLLVPIFIFYYAINRNLTNKNIEFQRLVLLITSSLQDFFRQKEQHKPKPAAAPSVRHMTISGTDATQNCSQ